MTAFAIELAPMLAQLLHVALLLIAAPLLEGLITTVRSRLDGHHVSPLAPARDLLRLVRRQPVLDQSALLTPWPAFAVACLLLAGSLVPTFARGMTSAPLAELPVIALLLAAATLAATSGALDEARAGPAPAETLAALALAAPAVLTGIVAAAQIAGSDNVDALTATLRDTLAGRVAPFLAPLALLWLALAALLLAAPPAPVPALSGRYLALARAAGMLRRLVLLDVMAALLPYGLADAASGSAAWAIGLAAWASRVIPLALGLAVLEARGLPHPSARRNLLGLALLGSLLAAALLFAGEGMA